MGTHDLDKIKGPITYEARNPEDINFIALKQDKSMNGRELFDVLRQDNKLKKFLSIIESKPKWPVFYDANGTVLSLPPIINSDTTKITLDTKNVFIEITGTDLHKIEVCLAVLAGQFSSHCTGENQFTIEQVKVTYEHSNETKVYPDLKSNEFDVELKYINQILGLQLNVENIR